MQITEATAADYAGWLPLWQGYLDFYEHALSPDITALTFARALDAAEPLFLLLAKEGEETLGFVTYVLHRSTWAEGYYCYLEDLFVTEAARGRGIARALIEVVAAAATDAGATRLYWVTDAANETAQRLYETVATRTAFVQYRRAL